MNEYNLQCLVTDWLITEYPDVMFRSDMGGVRLPIGLAKKMKRLQAGRRAWPDLFIAEPRKNYKGLFIEIKNQYEDLYTRTGRLRKNKHIQEQSQILENLRKRGYQADFGCGFYGIQNIIISYLEEK